MAFLFSEMEVKKVKRLQFGILGPEEVKASSVCAIESDRTFENGCQVTGGLMDGRLGAIDRDLLCKTCGMGPEECPGHFGHLELTKPMFHISFMNTTIKCMRCVCFGCSAILGDAPLNGGDPTPESRKIAAASRKKNPPQRLRAMMDVCRTKGICWSCSVEQPKYRRDGLEINAEFKEATDEYERKITVTADKAHQVLRNITDEDAVRLGFDPRYARPDWMLLTVLPIPPPHVRPSIHMGSSEGRSEDDLTIKLQDIVRSNRQLRELDKNGAPNHIQLQLARLLQYHLATFIDNLIPGQEPATTRTGRPLKSISQRLKGKEVAMAYPISTYAYPKPYPQP